MLTVFFANAAIVQATAKKNYPPAPVAEILKKQFIGSPAKTEYMQSVVRSYTLYPAELNEILQNEYQAINLETQRMKKIKQNWNKSSYAYRLLNYKLNEQISEEIAQTRKKYAVRKQKFAEFIKNAPANQPVYIIEATQPTFFYLTVQKNNTGKAGTGIQMSFSVHGIHYVSLFDHNYKHIFTYHRQHIDMLENRRFVIQKTRNERVNRSYQQIFDDYLTDLKRIGAGVDITNRDLLRQIGEMRDEYRSE